MLEKKDLEKIKEAAREFFNKMTVSVSDLEASSFIEKKDFTDSQLSKQEDKEIVSLKIKSEEPQILIGQGGQTLFEIQRLLRTVLNKKIHTAENVNDIFYLDLDINDYKKKKLEYLKDIAKELADQVSLTKETKVLVPMLAYERRVIHAELSGRADIITESQGEGLDRHIVIKAK